MECHEEEQILLTRVSVGDEKAFLMLYDKYWERLFVYAVNIVKDRNEAEDVVQEVFTKLWRVRESLLSVRNLNAYLITITRNQALKNILGSKRMTESIQSFIYYVEHDYPSLDKEYDAKELASLIEKHVDHLPEKMKEIFVLSRENGLSNKEIADSLNISEHTVKKQINNSLRRIRSSIRYILLIFMS
ncbi:MAG: RNA polymerase sigma-70 factor [Sphingobacterium sp.]|jgi:RNA polymerase sigma-70 factor (ECF subfamily)|nr:RNA polymerase sigma-70 factor [Sphingobacterium sp.]